MAIIINTKLGEHRGKKRVWIEGVKLLREGFQPGMKYDVDIKDASIVLRLKEQGSFMISRRERNGSVLPIIDLSVREIAELFDGVELLRIYIKKGSIVITSHHQEQRVMERERRIADKLERGDTLSVCSLFHGGGVLDKALHAGFQRAGVRTTVSIAVEMESDYIESSLRNNQEIWESNAIVIESPIQLVNLKRNPPEVDLLVAGIPCTGSSRSGRSKNKLQFAESHESAGALFFFFLQFVEILNPGCVIIENVPEYSNTASMEVIRSVFETLGYNMQERVLDGNEFGALERRRRLCVVALSKGINCGFSIDDVAPVRVKESCLHEILEPIPLDSERWKSFDYLTEKEARDIKQGKGFRRQLLSGEEPFCGVIGRSYQKCRSTEPFIVHPENKALSRLLTPTEHALVKGVPVETIAGLADTVAHEVLGQSVIFPMFEAVALSLGNALLERCTSSAKAA